MERKSYAREAREERSNIGSPTSFVGRRDTKAPHEDGQTCLEGQLACWPLVHRGMQQCQTSRHLQPQPSCSRAACSVEIGRSVCQVIEAGVRAEAKAEGHLNLLGNTIARSVSKTAKRAELGLH
eukprot:1696571-Pleurochrysis_carterae.AAC.2